MRLLPLAVTCLLVGIAPAAAQTNVDFSGTVNATCSLAAATNGTLALNGAADVLSSAIVGGTAGTITILSIGTDNTIEVAAPTLIAQGAGYSAGTDTLEVAYTGAGGLTLVDQPFTTSTTTFDVDTIVASVLTVNNRVTNTAGFTPGTYTTRTVVSCLP